MSNETIKLPDIGSSDEVEVIEISVQVGDSIEVETTLIVLESDKASMDIPSPVAGVVTKVLINEGDKVKEGSPIFEVELEGAATSETEEAKETEVAAEPEPVIAAAEPESSSVEEAPASVGRQEVRVPDIGSSEAVEIVEVSVSVGDQLAVEDGLITLETDKASMDVPSPYAGKLVELSVKEGDKVAEGDLIGYIEVVGAVALQAEAQPQSSAPAASQPATPAAAPAASASAPLASQPEVASGAVTTGKVHAGPAVRLLARELGVDLTQVVGSARKGRIVKEDLQNFVKQVMQQTKATSGTVAAGGAGIPPIPQQDFSQFGKVEEKPMGRLLKAGAVNLHRSWLNVPHVTQFDEADITDLEAFRKSMKAEAEKQGARLTPLPFMIKACALALKAFPQFNVSLGGAGDTLIWKEYVNIGFAVDTPDGLLVVVVKDADKKSVYELARESSELAAKAQNKQLKGDDMKGGCFTISSLGSIGGTAFTPIVNAPEVAILGVSKASMKPVWDGKAFLPRLMLPLSLSYDHRAINGADAARFTAYLAQQLSDIRKMLL
ncbi:dihydrolipoyllysine-residue acetyltransferase [Marinospirillum insulare]|uniref:Acetyltransferase component of pyruvate dehydrogenase complex n=1 Tax=Marinospirillum insulare TaxID=217169 RepID=A0ABQ5ZZX5_9GAMM|nr:dihydrolipoyllysine-residue acetyltransferase [Marinospirillum insulare]GLR63425.1 acetyltransferase component of pyruvate dehydrogenase complex [Marinospirillum insulare]